MHSGTPAAGVSYSSSAALSPETDRLLAPQHVQWGSSSTATLYDRKRQGYHLKGRTFGRGADSFETVVCVCVSLHKGLTQTNGDARAAIWMATRKAPTKKSVSELELAIPLAIGECSELHIHMDLRHQPCEYVLLADRLCRLLDLFVHHTHAFWFALASPDADCLPRFDMVGPGAGECPWCLACSSCWLQAEE